MEEVPTLFRSPAQIHVDDIQTKVQHKLKVSGPFSEPGHGTTTAKDAVI